MPRHRQSTSMEPASAPPMEAMEHHRPHDPKPVMPDALRRVRMTIVEEHPFDGSEEKTWQLDEPDYGPDGSHAVIQGELGI